MCLALLLPPDPDAYRPPHTEQPDPGAYRPPHTEQPDPGACRPPHTEQPDPGAYRPPDPGAYRPPHTEQPGGDAAARASGTGLPAPGKAAEAADAGAVDDPQQQLLAELDALLSRMDVDEAAAGQRRGGSAGFSEGVAARCDQPLSCVDSPTNGVWDSARQRVPAGGLLAAGGADALRLLARGVPARQKGPPAMRRFLHDQPHLVSVRGCG
jgi:hypothetical protein